MTISLQLSLNGSEKENVKAVLLTQNGRDVARWGENGNDLLDPVTVEPVQTLVTVFYADKNQDTGNIDPDDNGYVNVNAGGHGDTEIAFSLTID